MTNIWVTSDTHFNHANILNFTDSEGNKVRPFTSVEDMNQTIIERWNEVVKPGDKVYHLGDVFFGSKDSFKQLWPKLNGSKRLIVGNHEDIVFMSSGGFFKKVYESRDLRDFGLLLTHRPAHDSQLWDYRRDRPLHNIHGHLHQNILPSNNHTNVCVECTNYRPVNIEDLRLY